MGYKGRVVKTGRIGKERSLHWGWLTLKDRQASGRRWQEKAERKWATRNRIGRRWREACPGQAQGLWLKERRWGCLPQGTLRIPLGPRSPESVPKFLGNKHSHNISEALRAFPLCTRAQEAPSIFLGVAGYERGKGSSLTLHLAYYRRSHKCTGEEIADMGEMKLLNLSTDFNNVLSLCYLQDWHWEMISCLVS